MMLGVIFGMPGWGEMLIFAAVGLLIFGKRLPEVGKSLGKGIMEFKKGLSGVVDDNAHTSAQPPHTPSPPAKQIEQQPPTHTADAQETPSTSADVHPHP